MSRRVSLPGADELFRNTATLSAVPSQRENSEEITQAPVAAATQKNSVRQTPRRRVNAFDRAPSGNLGLAVDRGRIVRESLSIIIADLEAKGDQSIIARRLRGR